MKKINYPDTRSYHKILAYKAENEPLPGFNYEYPEHRIWKSAIGRCHNPNGARYKDYGGRGIFVAAEWRGKGGFKRFLVHIGRRPTPKHQLDRIDNDRGYEPGNVRWALPVEQNNNRRDTVFITAFGKTLPLTAWEHFTGINSRTIKSRLHRGRTPEQALTAKPGSLGGKLSANDVVAMRAVREKEGLSYKKLGARFGVSAQTAWSAVNQVSWSDIGQ